MNENGFDCSAIRFLTAEGFAFGFNGDVVNVLVLQLMFEFLLYVLFVFNRNFIG